MSKVHDKLTGHLIKQIEESGELPWEKPWNTQGGGAARSASSGRVYKGFWNQMTLQFEAMIRGYEDPRWITFNAAAKLGGRLKDEGYRKSTPIQAWRSGEKEVIRDGKKVTEKYFIAVTHNVFNVEQWEGLDLDSLEREIFEWDPIEKAENLISQIPGDPVIKHEGIQAFYHKLDDSITMPAMDRFENPEDYYGVLFHELGHWTGAASRLDRKSVSDATAYSQESYSEEELVAEITSAMLCGHIGINTPKRERDNVAYLKHWLKVLKSDTSIIVQAAQKAQKAVDYILGVKEEQAA